jgi:hypothetical protein
MAPLLSRHPLKAVTTFALLVAPSYLAILALLNLSSGRRPIREWSLKTTMGLACLKLFYRFATQIQLQPVYTDWKKLRNRYVLVQPGEPRLYKSILDTPRLSPSPRRQSGFPNDWSQGKTKLWPSISKRRLRHSNKLS